MAEEAYTEAVEQAADHAESGGLPQMDVTTFESQVVWLVITFALLYLVVNKLALPRLGNILAERETRIGQDLDAAEQLRKDADEVKAAYEQSLADARHRAQDLLLSTRDQIQSDIAAEQEKLDARLNADISAAESRIGAAKAEALKDVGTVAADVTTTLVSKLTGQAPDDKSVKSAVDGAMKGVG